ncbi:hypothetical protein QE152_g22464 [Popillia japonica]|uniref:Uncharacterized protein n=1 Tax=Popillia japonica TaxID=7064 RepID=A0AAW1KIQ4_POPJA
MNVSGRNQSTCRFRHRLLETENECFGTKPILWRRQCNESATQNVTQLHHPPQKFVNIRYQEMRLDRTNMTDIDGVLQVEVLDSEHVPMNENRPTEVMVNSGITNQGRSEIFEVDDVIA